MKSIFRNLFLILLISTIFQNCNNAQQAGPNVQEEASNGSLDKNTSTSNEVKFVYKSIEKMPSEIEYVEAMAVSTFKLFVLQEKKIYVLDPDETFSILSEFKLVDASGKDLPDINISTRIEYNEDLYQLFVLTENTVYRYDDDGKFLGELPKPLGSFKPSEIAFDYYAKGNVYILSKGEPAGEIFLWENVEQKPRSILTGRKAGFEIRSIAGGLCLSDRCLNILASNTLTTAIFEFAEDPDDIWKERYRIDESNGVYLRGATVTKLKSNFFNLFVLGSFERNAGDSFLITKRGSVLKGQNLYAGKIASFPKEMVAVPEVNKNHSIYDFAFGPNGSLLIRGGKGQIFKFEASE